MGAGLRGAVAGRGGWGAAVRGWLRFCCVSCCSSSLWWSMSLFIDMVIVLPVMVQDRVYGPDSAARGVPQLQFLDKVVTCPLFRRQVRGGAAGAVPVVVDVPVIMQGQVVSPTVELPQIQFIAPFEDSPVVQQRRVQLPAVGLPVMNGFSAF